MKIPMDSIRVEQAEGGYVARTTLMDGVSGCGSDESEAVANLGWAVRAHLRAARENGEPVPEAFRVSTGRKTAFVVAFIVVVVVLPVLVAQAVRWFRGE